MVRKKQTPRRTKKRVALTTLSPTVRGQFAPGFAPPNKPDLPSETTWNNMMSSLQAKYDTDQAMLDKYHEPTEEQWDEIEAADRRYKRPSKKKRKKGTSSKKKTPRKKKTPMKKRKRKVPTSGKKQKVCLTLMQIVKAFPDMAKKVCFHPKVSSFRSLMAILASSKKKASTFL